jgi:ribosome-binding protein aMBF1 (putative translation factor)
MTTPNKKRRSGKPSLPPIFAEPVMQRIRAKYEAEGQNKAAVARWLRSSPTSVQNWIEGYSIPSFETAAILAEVEHLSLDELVLGKKLVDAYAEIKALKARTA